MTSVNNSAIHNADKPQSIGSQKSILFVVAHPDDEVIFFGATIAREILAGTAVTIAFATGIFRDSISTEARRAEMQASCDNFGATCLCLGLRDNSEALLDVRKLSELLKASCGNGSQFSAIYTHGPWGEYGHLHHVSVCLATHCAFPYPDNVLTLAGPMPHNEFLVLDELAIATKNTIMRDIYKTQNRVRCWGTHSERFASTSRPMIFALASIALEPDYPLPTFSILSRSDMDHIREWHTVCERPPSEIERIPRQIWLPRLSRFVQLLKRVSQDFFATYKDEHNNDTHTIV